MEKYQFSFPNFNGEDIVIREGNAPDELVPNKLSVRGDINSIGNFLTVRKDQAAEFQEIDIRKIIVEVDRANLSIKLSLDPVNPYGASVTATLDESDELKPFHINKAQTFTKEQFVKLLRFNRQLFSDPDKHAQVLTAYQTFSAKAYLDLQSEMADQKGNRSASFTKKVESNIPSDFVMTAPIYKGQPSESFRVEIWLEVTEGGAKFWLESVELAELLTKRRDEIFAEQLKHCEGFVVINK